MKGDSKKERGKKLAVRAIAKANRTRGMKISALCNSCIENEKEAREIIN